MIRTTIITIGDELLFGQTLDTNSHFISAAMSEAGYNIVSKISIGDSTGEIKWALEAAEAKSEIILITGGLGPTRDDITKKTLTEYFNTTLQVNETALGDVTTFFQRKGLALSEINRQQAFIPANGKVIRNPVGTAPGIWIEKNGKVFISMPGVPHEMEYMIINQIIPMLKRVFVPPVIIHKSIMTAGIGESVLSEMIQEWENNLPTHIKLAYLPGLSQVKLRITSSGDDPHTMKIEISELVSKLERYIKKYIYGYDNMHLEMKIGEMLKKFKKKISVAESCTGGHIGHMITTVPGSSDYFMGGVIAYENSIKERILGVSNDTLNRYGAVSEETVKEMALNVKNKFGTQIGISTSGIAGPGGGSDEKPVGLLWVGISDEMGLTAKKFMYTKTRVTNIQYFTVAALTYLWQRLKQNHGIE